MFDISEYVKLHCMGIDTLMAYAFYRALGIETPAPRPVPIAYPRRSVYEGVADCFGNREHVNF